MSNPRITIRTCQDDDVAHAAFLLGHAFKDVPSMSGVVDTADRHHRQRVLDDVFALYINSYYRRRGVVDIAELDGVVVGAALWTPPGQHMGIGSHLRLLPQYLRIFRWQLPALAARQLSAHDTHPKDPHWYLFAMGVDPDMQGAGIGSSLLDHGIARAEGHAIYLEAASERVRGLYESRGFRAFDTIDAGVGEETETAMWRDA
ncbi:GNAT family N-acetyltransferase [Corynebacterium uterequi]|uniref:Acetyltransferase (GNAT) family protein n=1 Tax=Corynebacterium uterequi TaxID=1072256 RepID=A0A0G3H9M8_9CORY|nr:GNAT family N-acetyltransferase [Corynebacterium uterequi]AKK10076.1 acetyltransferase (GNAT) family protein [Corynebacterium uterequi]